MKKIFINILLLLSGLSAAEIYTTLNIEPQKSASLAFYSGGIVKSIYVDVSSEVKKGDKLIELQNDDLRASLAMAKAALDEAEINLKFAKKDYERQLLIKDLIDEAKFDSYELMYERAKVLKDQAKAKLDYQRSLLDKTAIYAPFDGIIFEKNVEIGDVVSSMMLRTLFKIQSKNKRKVILEFDQKYWKKVKVGDSVKYSINGDSKIYTGKISKLYPQANNNNRKVKAELIADNFMSGLFGDGYIHIPDNRE